jgi:hypothetical protein
MWSCVAPVRTDVLEEDIASIIRMKRIIELQTTFAATNNITVYHFNPLNVNYLPRLKNSIPLFLRS